MARDDDIAVTGEASDKRAVDALAADVPQGDAGVAAALSSPPAPDYPPPPPEPAEFVVCLPSRVGVCLHYKQGRRYIRENLTGPKCQERIQALAHDPEQVALWRWKRRQITAHSPT